MGDKFAYKSPALDKFPATEQEKKFAERYTAIRAVVCDGVPDAHTTWLLIDNQHFRLDGHRDTAEEASWTAWMLAKALIRVRYFGEPNCTEPGGGCGESQ